MGAEEDAENILKEMVHHNWRLGKSVHNKNIDFLYRK
jgi:hypothetical protein